MARTSDPHAATLKAWETRGRALQGSGSSPTQIRGDVYAKRGWSGERRFRGASDTEVARVTEQIRGKPWSLDDVADLAGAPPGSMVRIRVRNNDTLEIDTYFPNESGVTCRSIDLYGGRMANEAFDVKDTERAKGIGTSVFEQQVETAIKLGLQGIDVKAVGSPGRDNGYYTWARFGFESAKPVRGPNGMTTLHKLMREPGGAQWWLKNGHEFDGSFSLAEGSTSRRVFEEYRRLKKAKG